MPDQPEVGQDHIHMLHRTKADKSRSITEYVDVDASYCLIESQDWVGSDVIRPDCTTDASDPSCADPTNVSPDNERLANLYGNDVVWPHDQSMTDFHIDFEFSFVASASYR